MSEAAFLRGTSTLRPLNSVKPNGWNPNRVPEHIMRSIEHGFRTDGWLVSQALLVWGTDETGARRDVIIDGEHRWTAAQAVGLAEGPMVVLDGIREAEAKALTVKLNQKRGAWDTLELGKLLAEIDFDAISLGFDGTTLDALIATAQNVASATGPFAPQQIAREPAQPAQPAAASDQQFIVTVRSAAEARTLHEFCLAHSFAVAAYE